MNPKSSAFFILSTAVLAMTLFVSSVFAQRSVLLSHGTDAVEFTCVDDRTVKIAYLVGGVEDSASVILDPFFKPSGEFVSVDSGSYGLRLHAAKYSIEITAAPYIIALYDANHSLLFSTFADTGFTANSCWANIKQGEYYGFDNSSSDILRGSKETYIHSGDQGHASGMLTWSPNGLGLLADVDEGSAGVDGINEVFHYSKIKSHRRNNILFLTLGNPHQITSSFSKILGKPHLPPIWSLGFLHSKWGQDQNLVYSTAQTYRKNDIPVDAFALDYEWMDWGNSWGEFKWNPHSFPLAQNDTFADSLRQLGITLMGIRKPRIHLDQPEGHIATAQGYFLPGTKGIDDHSQKNVALLDFFNPDVRHWFWNSLIDSSRNPIARGIESFWNDETGYSRSLYGTYMQEAEYDGRRMYDNRRIFSLNRNFFIGANRFAYGVWTGDIESNFPALAFQRTNVLTSANIGAGWWSMDIGGFFGDADSTDVVSEMFIRWMQFGTFVPVCRIHSYINQHREPWFYGANAQRISSDYIRLRYTLLPYTYGLFRTFADEGLPPVRPFVFDYPDDIFGRSEARAYLFGPSIAVAPVVDYLARSATFYLPIGTWVNYWNDSLVTGGSEITMNAGLEQMPILIKRGAIIPERAYGRYSLDSNAFRDIRFHVYAGTSDSLTYYEDDFTTYDYENGVYAKVPFSHRFSNGIERITIGRQIGSYVPKKRRGYFIFHCLKSEVDSVRYNGILLPFISRDSLNNSSIQAWAFDTDKNQLVVAIADPFSPSDIEIYLAKDTFPENSVSTVVSFDVVPNPAQHSLRCVITAPNDENAEITVVSTSGLVVIQKKILLRENKNIIELDSPVISPGTYFITVQTEGWRRTTKAVLIAR